MHTEQGLGDTFQFIRYADLIKLCGGVVLVRAPKTLLRILRLCPYIDGLFAEGGELPEFDVYAPLLSLPRIFKTELESVPGGAAISFCGAGTRCSLAAGTRVH